MLEGNDDARNSERPLTRAYAANPNFMGHGPNFAMRMLLLEGTILLATDQNPAQQAPFAFDVRHV